MLLTKKYLIPVLIMAFVGQFMPLAFCEDAKTTKEISLSLDEAVLIAYKNNKDIQIQEQEIAAAKGGIVDARSAFLPSLNASYAYTHNSAVSPISVQGKKDIGVFTGYQNDNNLGINLNQLIYNGRANVANYKQAQLGLNVQEETLRAKKLDVEFETKRLYFGLQLAYETERITQELYDNAKDHFEDVKNKFEEGTSSRFDLLQSKVQVALLMPELIKAKNAIDLILADLKKLLGFKMFDLIALKNNRLGYSLIPIQEEEFLKESYLNKPEMALKSLGIDISQWSIVMARAGWRPQINADFGYTFRSNNWATMFNSRHEIWQTGVSVSFPIFDGFSSKAKVDEAKARYAQANLAKENLIDQIAVDIRQACLDLKQAQAIIDSQKENIGEAREALRIANVSYDNGVNTNLDVLDAEVSLSQTENNFCQGIYDYLIAEAFLDRTRGKSLIKPQLSER